MQISCLEIHFMNDSNPFYAFFMKHFSKQRRSFAIKSPCFYHRERFKRLSAAKLLIGLRH